MAEVGASTLCTLLSKVLSTTSGGIINQDETMAVSKAANQSPTRVFIDVRANSIYILAQLQPIRVAFNLDWFTQHCASCGFNQSACIGG